MSTDVGTPKATGNPYVGPQSFRRGDAFYGRDHETADLLDLLIAERVVLLHSPSGAGKSSLIAAGLIHLLEAEGFEVLPVVRVTHEPPPDSALVGPPRNRYVLSTLLSLEEGLPPQYQRHLDELEAMTVTQYLTQWPDLDHQPGNEVLVFDQFEEVITADPNDRDAKEEFFADIGTALRDRNLWALFSIREDFLAELDPYARLIPTRFTSRYRLDLLGVDQALEAMILPAADRGVDFKRPAAEKLVDDLRRIRVQRPTGVTEELGPNVEPVQLQVACRQVWDRLDEAAGAIDVKDVEAVGNVDQALASYYADCVADAAAQTGIGERALRDWFEHELVTPQGIRAQVLQGPPQNGAFGERAVRMLTDAHLVRAESRRGAMWYELAHDRLIEPVQEDNARWRDEHLSDFERRAAWWDVQSRPDQLLLVDAELTAAEAVEMASTDPLPQRERDFLEASRKARDNRERERRAARRTQRLLVVAVIGGVLALIAAVAAIAAWSRARDLTTAAEASALAGQASGAVGWDTDLSLLLAQEAATLSGRSSIDSETRNALQLAVDQTPVVTALRGRGPAKAAAYTEDGTLVATAHEDGTVVVWNPESGEELDAFSDTSGDGSATTVHGVDFSPDGRTLAAVGANGSVLLYPVLTIDEYEQSASPENQPDRHPVPLDGHGQPSTVWRVAFSPDGSQVASAGTDGLAVTDVETGRVVHRPGTANGTVAVNDAEWTPDGRQVVAVDDDGVVSVWPVGARSVREFNTHLSAALAVDMSPSGDLVASAAPADDVVVVTELATGTVVYEVEQFAATDVSFSSDGSRVVGVDRYGNAGVSDPALERVVRWARGSGMSLIAADVDPSEPGRAVVASEDSDPAVWDVTAGHTDIETALDSGPGGTAVSASWDGSVSLWSADQRRTPLVPAQSDQVQDAVLSPDGTLVALARRSGAVEVWSTDSSEQLLDLTGHVGGAWTVAFSPDGHNIATGGADNLVRLWDVMTGDVLDSLEGHSDDVVSVDYGEDAGQLVSISYDKTGIVWDLDRSTRARVLRLEIDPTAVAWSPAGDLVVAAGSDGSVEYWNPGTGAQLGKHSEHATFVNDIAFDATGERVVSSGNDRTIIVWDAATGAVQHRIRHGAAVYEVAFRSDGDELLVADGRGVPYVVWLNGAELLRVAQERTTRDLSSVECKLYLDPDTDCPED